MYSHSRQRPSNNKLSSFQYQALEPRCMLAGDVVISEFVASNTGSFEDVYGDSPDWIELHNQGDTAVDLLGYHLTDDAADPIGWTFDSSLVINPGEYKVVFASSRNEIDPAGYFHTDFSLSAGGEYIGLFDDNGTLRSEFGTDGDDYPPQLTDVSYGVSGGSLVNRASVSQYLIPTDDSLLSTWTDVNFDASANGFSTGRASIGYENSPSSNTSYVDEILTTVPSGTTAVYHRTDFYLDDASAITELVLNLKYDDGFAAILNDNFMFSENDGNGYSWNSPASGTHNDSDALQYQSYAIDGSAGSVGNFLSVLQNGKNTLAIHALNGPSSSDFLMSPQLLTNASSRVTSYLNGTTPEQPNAGLTAIGPLTKDVTPSGSTIVTNGGQPLIVTAEVSNFDLPVDTNSVELHYRVMFGNEVAVPMIDDGTGPDLVANDGVYSAPLNGFGLAPGTLVRWYVTASDVSGIESRAPRFFDALNSAEYFGSVVVDATITTDLPVIQWFIEDTDAADTDAGTRASIFYDGQFYDNVQVDIHGQSTRGSEFIKKSYNFDANSGEKFDVTGIGIASDFNLLTNYADQTKLRHPLSYEILTESGIPALKGTAVEVYRNGSYYGLFDVIEEGDEEYLERVGLDPNGALYKVNNELNHAYNQVNKRSRSYEDHSDLQELVNANSLSGTAASIWDFDNLDIAAMVNFLAAQSVTSNFDFGQKNMHWYRDTEGTGLWTPLPWDQDLSLGHKWTFGVSPPYFDNTLYPTLSITSGWNNVYQRVFSNPATSDMYFRRLKTLTDQFYGTSSATSFLYQRFNEIEAQLADEIIQDQNAWGIHTNFAAAYPFNPFQAIDQLRDAFIDARRSHINNDSRTPSSQIGVPTILFDDNDFDSSPASGLQAEEYVRLNNPGNIAVDISGWTLNGGISHTFRAGTVIPALGSLYVVSDVKAFQARISGPHAGLQLFIQGNYQGQLSNLGDTVDLYSSNGTFVDTLTTPFSGQTPNQEFLRISEINYNPADSVPDGEFIELLNTGPGTLDISGVSLTEGPSTPFVFPANTFLGSGQRLLLVQDATAFIAAYPNVNPALIAGDYSGKLSNGGENVRLEESGGTVIAEVSYNDTDPWYFGTDGDGQTLQLVDEFNTSLLLVDKYYSWRPSYAINGTPGEIALIDPPKIVINEVLAHTDLPQVDSIELYNASNQSFLIGGMFLSDSANDLLKYEIPSGTVLGAGDYIVFDETHFNPNPSNPGPKDFSLSAANGDQVWLTFVQNGLPFAVFDQVDFGATFNGESLARQPNGTGRLLPSSTLTLGAENSIPRVGPLIISEVNYHPGLPSSAALATLPGLTSQELEFVEITNPTLQTVDLTNWNLRGELDFDFAESSSLAPGETLVVVTFDPDSDANDTIRHAFTVHYGINPSTTIVGADGIGNLSNNFGRITLQQPDSPPASDPTLIPRVLADEVVYDDLLPWPTQADGTDPSINRNEAGVEGNDVSNWFVDLPTPGAADVKATVLTRTLFYNNSVYDGGSGAANPSDDSSLAFDKAPLLNGATATLDNYSNYVHGINGIMIDVIGLRSTPNIGDFEFLIGNNDITSTWIDAPDPVSISIRPGDGMGVADRITLIWADGAITNTWLQVKMSNGGLANDNVFYFGNVIGESGNDLASAIVDLADVGTTRINQSGFSLVPIDHPQDYNRDRRVDLVDVGIARVNQSGFSRVNLITPDGSSSSSNFGSGGSAGDSNGRFGEGKSGGDNAPGTGSPPQLAGSESSDDLVQGSLRFLFGFESSETIDHETPRQTLTLTSNASSLNTSDSTLQRKASPELFTKTDSQERPHLVSHSTAELNSPTVAPITFSQIAQHPVGLESVRTSQSIRAFESSLNDSTSEIRELASTEESFIRSCQLIAENWLPMFADGSDDEQPNELQNEGTLDRIFADLFSFESESDKFGTL